MRIALVTTLLCVLGVPAIGLAAPAAPPPAAPQRVAIWRIDPLGGLSPEIVARLESLLTAEMGRLVPEIVPSVKAQQVQRRVKALRGCEGEDACLAALGRALKANRIVAGTLASLGQDYVVTLKLVDAATGKALLRFSEPMSGQAEQLIEAVRVAAYRLLAPERLKGDLQVLVSIPGAAIFVDGRRVGESPLRSALSQLEVREHQLRITHPDYLDFVKKVAVRFQKTTLVQVTMQRPRLAPPVRDVAATPGPPVVRDTPTPWYSRWWFWTIVGAVAVGTGLAVGLLVPPRTYEPRKCDHLACEGGTP
jgi:hypothetical protein